MSRSAHRWVLALAVGLIASACSPAPVRWSLDAGETLDFESTRSAFTRSNDVYEGAEGRIFARATWFAPRFAAALAGWQAQRAGSDDAARTAAVDEAVAKAKAETWVFVALNTHEFEWNDLGQPASTLKVRLNVDGAWLEPTAVNRLSLDEMADRRVVFPYADNLTVGYDIVFPKVADPERVRLEVGGIPGRAEMRWRVR